MKWLDVRDIAIALESTHPACNILGLRFTELKNMVLQLDGFEDDPSRCNEKILEAIQMIWLDERD